MKIPIDVVIKRKIRIFDLKYLSFDKNEIDATLCTVIKLHLVKDKQVSHTFEQQLPFFQFIV